MQSLHRESECEGPGTSSTTEQPNTTTVIQTFMTNITSPSTDLEPDGSDALGLITIVVPAVGGAVLLALSLLVVVIVCCSCLYRVKRRRKSLHIGLYNISKSSGSKQAIEK